ncbi:hypothetical protein AZF37_06270 [endosymbiont 'TC1' of Trimyema compressum]|uniref:aminoacyl-histidine dipeptidase n=1 Tax=endosymbiont 'TC1' of Trimyema compressum TaxID=243899 RepID=UPI0007F055ED|nr:aminoacyl-histidine dipeptidase [endosymbiont 'TC1' of Trimyema compressum]AMP20829.1 hypothetical protein AZF37_06270 [endosymbiont 'TC1' of Trimyema compressum]
MNFDQLESKDVFHFFEAISQIPRCSKKEGNISNYLKGFAQERDLWAKQDEANNIIIKKPGTGSLKDGPIVILQGHMDMVCEKKADSKHDFSKDPIKWVVNGDDLYADGTTLGADDGIGVAFCLALLDSQDIEHPPLEVLFTTDEETGMTGAHALDASVLEGKIFMNIDTEEEGKFYASCAGGNTNAITIPIKFKETQGLLLSVRIFGLLGGHSGLEIAKERANANKLMGRFLNNMSVANIKFSLGGIFGGAKNNAIPRECRATVLIEASSLEKVNSIIATLEEELQAEYTPQDSNIKIVIEDSTQGIFKVMSVEDSLNVATVLTLIPYGPLSRSQYIEGLVQTSMNNGIVKTTENHVLLESALRSSIKSQGMDLVNSLSCLAEAVDGTAENYGFYPAWAYEAHSKVRDLCTKCYNARFDNKGEVVAIHAGLECGIFKEKMPDIDAISFGPTIIGAHTAEEHLSISSTERVWKFIKAVLQDIKSI